MFDLNALVNASNLSKSYSNNIFALKKINFTLSKGITALIGPNGAGKTTLLKLILGLLKPSAGSLKIFNLDSWNDSALIHEYVGIIYENHKFPENLTVKRYLELISYFFDKEKTIDVKHFINFPIDRHIYSLSAGMYRKLSLYQCFFRQPNLIIMDEPTANLDPIARKDLLDTIKEIHEMYEINFIISSHILSDLESIATNVIVLNKGEIKFQGKYSVLINTYFSNQYELFIDDSKEWEDFLLSLAIFKSVQNYDNRIVLMTDGEMESNALLTLLLTSKNHPKSNINLFRKILDIEEIFK